MCDDCRERRGHDGHRIVKVKWMIGASVAAIIAIGIIAVAVSVTVLQFSRIEADMQTTSIARTPRTDEVILGIEMLVNDIRDDYRDLMHGVEDVLRELRTPGALGRSPTLRAGASSNEHCRTSRKP